MRISFRIFKLSKTDVRLLRLDATALVFESPNVQLLRTWTVVVVSAGLIQIVSQVIHIQFVQDELIQRKFVVAVVFVPEAI